MGVFKLSFKLERILRSSGVIAGENKVIIYNMKEIYYGVKAVLNTCKTTLKDIHLRLSIKTNHNKQLLILI